MSVATIAVEVRVAWWLRPYLAVLVFFCRLRGTLPDEERLSRVIRCGLSARVFMK